jgi:hypothetical protein
MSRILIHTKGKTNILFSQKQVSGIIHHHISNYLRASPLPLAYYLDHQDEINIDLKEASDEGYWKERVLYHPAQKDIED